MKYYHKFAEFCYTILRHIAMVTVAAMLAIMLTEVMRRYLFSATWIWSDEIIRYLLIYCTYFGGAAAYYKHSMVSFDLITSKLSERVRDILSLITNIILTVFFAFMLYNTYFKMTSASVAKSISTASGFRMPFRITVFLPV
ncbi:MAG: TRAP transporter small permease subunit [Spirochaetales bacterium]|jgi:TRAP-type C4-dicarboxylate transport system permease small subunit|nr:TRAP transporter small permease subunit [Spirochaetales bacterium]